MIGDDYNEKSNNNNEREANSTPGGQSSASNCAKTAEERANEERLFNQSNFRDDNKSVSSAEESSKKYQEQRDHIMDQKDEFDVAKSPSSSTVKSPSSSPHAGRQPSQCQQEITQSQRKTSQENIIADHPGERTMHVDPVEPRCKSLAVLGTMSDAGKSIMTAGICRVLSNNNVRVAPFKGQNMSNNASPALLPEANRRRRLYETFHEAVGSADGELLPEEESSAMDDSYGEIGTAQSLQAEACRVIPRVEMNPVLLKSGGQNEKGEFLCSVVVLGKQVVRETYGDLAKRTTDLRSMVLESHRELAQECDVIVMEGAGSCTELNLMDRDIVNLPLVRALQCPWLLVANIDCGGVFAQIAGTQMCVSTRDWALCAGIIVNKLRGEQKYFDPGPKIIEEMVGKPVFVVPFLRDLNLPEEDGVGIERRLAWEASGQHPESSNHGKDHQNKPLIVVIAYPHTAISDDLCPLEGDPRFRVQWRSRRIPSRPYPHTTAVIMPGSRLTLKDLEWLHDSGWATFLRKHVAAGGNVLGICGGYQMLGRSVDDPGAVEGIAGMKQGMEMLPIQTTIAPPKVKVVAPRKGKLFKSNTKVQGFELHCGQTEIVMEQLGELQSNHHPLVVFDDGKPEGMCLGRVRGTYMHGILWSPEARVELLVPEKKDFPVLQEVHVRDPLDRLAEHLEKCGLNFDTLQRFIGSQ